ncbi:MAG: hypothetical protein ACLQHS_00055 [Candidatus Limnocylindrales bacterium]
MSHRLVTVESLQVGARRLGRATLNLYRDEPAPGVRGAKRWTVFGRVGRSGPLPEDSDAVMVLGDGRTVAGRALLASSRTSADWRGRTTEYEYQGTGPLDGTTDADYG